MSTNPATTPLSVDSAHELADIRRESAASLSLVNGLVPDFNVDLSQWLTIKRYTDKYAVTKQVVNNWINRGVIPPDCIQEIPELNDIRLIFDRPYNK